MTFSTNLGVELVDDSNTFALFYVVMKKMQKEIAEDLITLVLDPLINEKRMKTNIKGDNNYLLLNYFLKNSLENLKSNINRQLRKRDSGFFLNEIFNSLYSLFDPYTSDSKLVIEDHTGCPIQDFLDGNLVVVKKFSAPYSIYGKSLEILADKPSNNSIPLLGIYNIDKTLDFKSENPNLEHNISEILELLTSNTVRTNVSSTTPDLDTIVAYLMERVIKAVTSLALAEITVNKYRLPNIKWYSLDGILKNDNTRALLFLSDTVDVRCSVLNTSTMFSDEWMTESTMIEFFKFSLVCQNLVPEDVYYKILDIIDE